MFSKNKADKEPKDKFGGSDRTHSREERGNKKSERENEKFGKNKDLLSRATGGKEQTNQHEKASKMSDSKKSSSSANSSRKGNKTQRFTDGELREMEKQKQKKLDALEQKHNEKSKEITELDKKIKCEKTGNQIVDLTLKAVKAVVQKVGGKFAGGAFQLIIPERTASELEEQTGLRKIEANEIRSDMDMTKRDLQIIRNTRSLESIDFKNRSIRNQDTIQIREIRKP